MWFLHRKVLLTKDNLAKKNWHGSSHCSFCGSDESIEHLFISCPFAKLVWRVVFCTYNIPPPTNATNMFGNWLCGMDKKIKDRIHIGVSAICWSIWNCRNNLVFSRKDTFHVLQVIHMAVHWIQLWAFLLPSNQRDLMMAGCTRLLLVAREFFSWDTWQHTSLLS